MPSVSEIANWSSIIGLFFGLVAFIIAIAQLERTRKAATAAKNAVEDFDIKVRRLYSSTDLARALQAFEELKRLIYDQNFDRVPERIASIQEQLIAVRASAPNLSDAERQILQGVIANLEMLEIETLKRFHSLQQKNLQVHSVIVDEILPDVGKLRQILVNLKTFNTEVKDGK